jgi:hypothetical protein
VLIGKVGKTAYFGQYLNFANKNNQHPFISIPLFFSITLAFEGIKDQTNINYS